MEWIETVVSIISNLGFPIACCIGLFWMMNTQNERHSTEMNTVTEAINNNTCALIKLAERLGVDIE